MFASRRITTLGGDQFRDDHSLQFVLNEYLDFGDITTLDGLADFSFAYWVKFRDDTSQMLFSKGIYGGNGNAFGGYFNESTSSGRFRFSQSRASGEFTGFAIYLNTALQFLPQNIWHHIVITVSDTNNRAFFYFNK